MATSEAGQEAADSDEDTEGAEPPEIEEDLIKETIRIDGICGVY
jgi:mycofactocin precursor